MSDLSRHGTEHGEPLCLQLGTFQSSALLRLCPQRSRSTLHRLLQVLV